MLDVSVVSGEDASNDPETGMSALSKSIKQIVGPDDELKIDDEASLVDAVDIATQQNAEL